jgi:predicted Zn-dependent protease
VPAAAPGARPRGERAGPAGDPFTLASDGTLTLAPRSAPFDDLGEPVRRFDLVRAGAAADLALDYREAVLARATPNGGARNLVLAPGPTSAAILQEASGGRLLRIDELAWLDVDPRSGALTAGIGLAELRRPGARPVRVTGGLLVGNVFALFERARLSTEVGALGWYRGPTSVRIDGVEIVGA